MLITKKLTSVQVLNMGSFYLVFEKTSISKEEVGWEIQLSISSWNKLLHLIKYWEDRDPYPNIRWRSKQKCWIFIKWHCGDCYINRRFGWWRHLTTTTIIHHSFCLLCNCYLTPLGLQNLINKEKSKGILVVVVKWRLRANLLLAQFALMTRRWWSIIVCANLSWWTLIIQLQNILAFFCIFLN